MQGIVVLILLSLGLLLTLISLFTLRKWYSGPSAMLCWIAYFLTTLGSAAGVAFCYKIMIDLHKGVYYGMNVTPDYNVTFGIGLYSSVLASLFLLLSGCCLLRSYRIQRKYSKIEDINEAQPKPRKNRIVKMNRMMVDIEALE